MSAPEPSIQSLPPGRTKRNTTVRIQGGSTSSHLMTLITIIVVIGVLYFAREVLIPVALAVLLAFLLTPVVARFEKLGLGRIPALLVVVVLVLALLGAAGWGLEGQLTKILNEIPNYTANIQRKIQFLEGSKAGGLSRAITGIKRLSSPPAKKPGAAAQQEKTPVQPIPVKVEAPASGTVNYVRHLIGPVADILATAGIVFVFTLFMLAEREDLRNRVLRLAGRGQLNTITRALDDASQRISRYLLLQLLVNSSYGVLFGFGLYLLGVPHAALWGIVGGVLRFIPYFGTLIGAVFPVVTALAVFPGWSHALYVLALYLGIELTVANVLEPLLYGSHTGISPFAILVAAIFWTMLWGPVGLVLSVPLTVCLTVLGRHIPELEFLGIFLADEPVLPVDAQFYQRLLALDQDEANDIVQAYLKDNPLESLYEHVFVPALALAERDRHMKALDEDVESFVYQSTKDLVEDLGEAPEDAAPAQDTAGMEGSVDTGEAAPPPEIRKIQIICIPARDEADEIVGKMLAQLLERSGFSARLLPLEAVSGVLSGASRLKAEVVCLSALPPSAVSRARLLCKRLRLRFPTLKMVLGLWNFEGGIARAEERVGGPCADRLATTLSEAIAQVRQLIEPESTGIGHLESSANVPGPVANLAARNQFDEDPMIAESP
jgi:predicted PurR-regulated permease PerM